MIFYLNDRCKKIHILVFKHYTLQTNAGITANGCILDKFGRRTVFAVIISFLACHILQAYLGKLRKPDGMHISLGSELVATVYKTNRLKRDFKCHSSVFGVLDL